MIFDLIDGLFLMLLKLAVPIAIIGMIIYAYLKFRKKKIKERPKIDLWDAMQELINYLEEKVESFDKKEYIKRAEARTKSNREKEKEVKE